MLQHPKMTKLFLETRHQIDLSIKAIAFKEIKNEIRSNLNHKKVSGYHLIKGSLIKELPDKAPIILKLLFNAILKTSHFPS